MRVRLPAALGMLMLSVNIFWMNCIGYAEPLNFEQALQQALQHSYALKIAQTEIGISQAEVISARSEYFPVIQARASLERLKGLQSQPGNVTTIGTMVLPTGTRYQDTVGLSLTHTLLDFGVRKRKLSIAKKDVQVKTTPMNNKSVI